MDDAGLNIPENLQVSRTTGAGGILDYCALPWREVTTVLRAIKEDLF